jgi:hypothetical protein
VEVEEVLRIRLEDILMMIIFSLNVIDCNRFLAASIQPGNRSLAFACLATVHG